MVSSATTIMQTVEVRKEVAGPMARSKANQELDKRSWPVDMRAQTGTKLGGQGIGEGRGGGACDKGKAVESDLLARGEHRQANVARLRGYSESTTGTCLGGLNTASTHASRLAMRGVNERPRCRHKGSRRAVEMPSRVGKWVLR